MNVLKTSTLLGQNKSNPIFKFSDEVSNALAKNLPIVALESTIITHGMPYPQNLSTAQNVESIIKKEGCVPATIAIIEGIIHIGLTDSELRHLSKLAENPKTNPVHKCSRRDLPFILSQKKYGSTTVAATMYIASLVGIPVFVTGGIGGVHRGANDSWDVSGDLVELGRTPVCVVCAGIKSILDIPKTLEYMETQGVTVMTLGQTQFPSFFTSDSGSKSPLTVENTAQIAATIDSHYRLRLSSGVLVGVPNPNSAEYQSTEVAIRRALKECSDRNIEGRDVTPFLLQRVAELTDFKSLTANIALIRNNAKIGAQIAQNLYRLRNNASQSINTSIDLDIPASKRDIYRQPTAAVEVTYEHSPVIIGGMTSDIIAYPNKNVGKLLMHTSNPGKIKYMRGGVARNMAESMARLGHFPSFISAVGNDHVGLDLIRHLQQLRIDTAGIKVSPNSDHATSTYLAIYTAEHDLHMAVADLSVLEASLTTHYLRRFVPWIRKAPIVVLDGNLTTKQLQFLIHRCKDARVPVWFEPISVEKGSRIVNEKHRLDGVTYISPNEWEVWSLLRATNYPHPIVEDPSDFERLKTYGQWLVECGAQNVIISVGSSGVIVVNREFAKHFPAASIAQSAIRNTNGAGDNLCAGVISGILDGKPLEKAVEMGLLVARTSLLCDEAVNPKLSRKYLSRQPLAKL